MKPGPILWIFALFLSSSRLCRGIPREHFLDYGDSVQDESLPPGDIQQIAVPLKTPINFYNDIHHTVYINTDGVITFTPGIQGQAPYPFDLSFKDSNVKAIAPFMADLDTSRTGKVYYREIPRADVTEDIRLSDEKNREDLDKEIARYMKLENFYSGAVFIVTWEDVQIEDLAETVAFQLVLTTDGYDTVAMFFFDDKNQSPESMEYWPQVGFNAGDSQRFFSIPGSMTSAIFDQTKNTNLGVLGLWAWHIGMENMAEGNVIAPPRTPFSGGTNENERPIDAGGPNSPINPTRSSQPGGGVDFGVPQQQCQPSSSSDCDANAQCVPVGSYYCCRCLPGFFGNGKTCLADGEPRRINGKVSATINGVSIQDVDLHSYTVTDEGRAYTAISRVPVSLGYSMQSLTPLGTIIGWIFAVPSERAANGFSITGGKFTRTARLLYSTGEEFTITQDFTGIDDLGYMRVNTQMEGNIPSIPSSAEITREDYQVVYNRAGTGSISSTSQHVVQILDGTDRSYDILYSLDQTIEYSPECDRAGGAGALISLITSVSKQYIIFDRNEQILRFAMTNAVSLNVDLPEVDPCLAGNPCGPNGLCIAEGIGYRCECNRGFTGNGLYCIDIDECLLVDGNDCASNAICINTEGTYYCQCAEGFVGDGRTCSVDQTDLQPETSFLAFSQGMMLLKRPFNPENEGSKIMSMGYDEMPVGISHDCVDNNIYWTDITQGAIMRSSYDGAEKNVLISDLSSPEGIDIDWIGRNMYWTDSGFDKIEVANLDGSNRKVLFESSLLNPRAIVVDPVGGNMYWSDWGGWNQNQKDSPRIETSYMDGTNRHLFVDTGLELPNGLTIDYTERKICWADAGTKKVECISQNGQPRTRYTVTSSAGYPFGLTNFGNDLYWTDWESKSIQSANKYGGSLGIPLDPPFGRNERLFGITAVTSCPVGENECKYNGGCQYLCLARPFGRKCACPTALTEQEICEEYTESP